MDSLNELTMITSIAAGLLIHSQMVLGASQAGFSGGEDHL
jgi:hypothetical protein